MGLRIFGASLAFALLFFSGRPQAQAEEQGSPGYQSMKTCAAGMAKIFTNSSNSANYGSNTCELVGLKDQDAVTTFATESTPEGRTKMAAYVYTSEGVFRAEVPTFETGSNDGVYQVKLPGKNDPICIDYSQNLLGTDVLPNQYKKVWLGQNWLSTPCGVGPSRRFGDGEAKFEKVDPLAALAGQAYAPMKQLSKKLDRCLKRFNTEYPKVDDKVRKPAFDQAYKDVMSNRQGCADEPDKYDASSKDTWNEIQNTGRKVHMADAQKQGKPDGCMRSPKDYEAVKSKLAKSAQSLPMYYSIEIRKFGFAGRATIKVDFVDGAWKLTSNRVQPGLVQSEEKVISKICLNPASMDMATLFLGKGDDDRQTQIVQLKDEGLVLRDGGEDRVFKSGKAEYDRISALMKDKIDQSQEPSNKLGTK